MVEFILGLLIGLIVGFFTGIWAVAYIATATYLNDPEEFNRKIDLIRKKLDDISK